MASFKLRESVHQLEMKLRTYEGYNDALNVTLIPYNKPKTAEIVEIRIKSLSLHKKIELDEDLKGIFGKFKEENMLNVLNIKGRFLSS